MAGTVFPDVFMCPWCVFSRMTLYTDGGCKKKQEVIYCSRRLLLVHETHGHLLQGIASGRKKVFMVSWCHKYKNVGQFDLPSAFVLNNTWCRNSHLWWGTCQYCSSCLILILQISIFLAGPSYVKPQGKLNNLNIREASLFENTT